MPKERVRCPWTEAGPLCVGYHDEEWGVPVRDDRRLFEMLVLEGAQAGLSWNTVLARRDGYRRALDGFDPARVARYGPEKVAALLRDPGIIRNRAKVLATIRNARAFLALQGEEGSFAAFVWRFVGGVPLAPRRRRLADVPAETDESRALSKALRRRGFAFVGPTICYAFMQAVGMVNDHLVTCFRHRAVSRGAPASRGAATPRPSRRAAPGRRPSRSRSPRTGARRRAP
jgi:DNA-3-methyladenine glycosylase I